MLHFKHISNRSTQSLYFVELLSFIPYRIFLPLLYCLLLLIIIYWNRPFSNIIKTMWIRSQVTTRRITTCRAVSSATQGNMQLPAPTSVWIVEKATWPLTRQPCRVQRVLQAKLLQDQALSTAAIADQVLKLFISYAFFLYQLAIYNFTLCIFTTFYPNGMMYTITVGKQYIKVC